MLRPQEELSQDWSVRVSGLCWEVVPLGDTAWDIIHQKGFSVEILSYAYSWLYHCAAQNKPSVLSVSTKVELPTGFWREGHCVYTKYF